MTAYILSLSCSDRPGIVADVASFLTNAGSNITEAQQFNDEESGQFFMRMEFDNPGELTKIESEFSSLVDRYKMKAAIRVTGTMRKVLILVSKFDHCMGDLLYRVRIGELNMEPVGIVSNHPRESLHLSTDKDIPYHYLPISQETKSEQELEIRAIMEKSGAELIVLARYMQILSEGFSQYLSGRWHGKFE